MAVNPAIAASWAAIVCEGAPSSILMYVRVPGSHDTMLSISWSNFEGNSERSYNRCTTPIRCASAALAMPKPYSLDLRERVVRFVAEGHSRRAAAAHFRVSVSFVVNLVKAFRVRGSLAPKPSGGRRHAKLEPHRAFLLEKVAEKADITMPELAAELAAATCEKADPASLSRWLIRIGYRFKKNSGGERTRSPRHQASARGMDQKSANRGCGLSRTGSSSWTRLEPPPR